MPVNVSFSPSVKRVADVDRAVVVQADDVAGVGLVGVLAVGRQERQRVGDADLLAEAHVEAAACPCW